MRFIKLTAAQLELKAIRWQLCWRLHATMLDHVAIIGLLVCGEVLLPVGKVVRPGALVDLGLSRLTTARRYGGQNTRKFFLDL